MFHVARHVKRFINVPESDPGCGEPPPPFELSPKRTTFRVFPSREEDPMAKQSKAVLCLELDKPVVVETVEIASPRRNEVMIKMEACGVIEEVGEGVSEIAVGDRVIVSWVPMCGTARPREDFPKLLGLYQANRLKLDELVTSTYGVDDAPRAFDDLEKGLNARGVIVF